MMAGMDVLYMCYNKAEQQDEMLRQTYRAPNKLCNNTTTRNPTRRESNHSHTVRPTEPKHFGHIAIKQANTLTQ